MGKLEDEWSENDSQPIQCRFNVRKLKEDGTVGDLLVVEHEADPPYDGREADVLSAGQIVQHNLGLILGGHAVLNA